MSAMRGKKVKRICEICGTEFTARIADVKRGWATHCSKSCSAVTKNKVIAITKKMCS